MKYEEVVNEVFVMTCVAATLRGVAPLCREPYRNGYRFTMPEMSE